MFELREPTAFVGRNNTRRAKLDLKFEPMNASQAAVSRLFAADDSDLDEEMDFDVPSEGRSASEPLYAESALEFVCEDGWRIRLAATSLVNVVVDIGGSPSVHERDVRLIRVGDHLLLINGLRRQSMYELIVSRIHQRASMELHLALIKRWSLDFVMAYREWTRKGNTLEDLLLQMQRRGSRLTSIATLRLWLQGETLAPLDAEDLKRLAQVASMDFVEKYYKRIEEAASILRGIHRGLANRLNRWLERRLAGSDLGDDEVVNQELGLTFGDFKNSLVVAAVLSINQVQGPVLQSSLGVLSRGA
jgi:hypothetical protein